MCPYVYENAVSPHLASRLEGSPVELECVEQVCKNFAANTISSSARAAAASSAPYASMTRSIMLEDIIKALGLPCIIVADAGLGTINSRAHL